jgi:RNA polymerase sigma factor (TIGR02999 family)
VTPDSNAQVPALMPLVYGELRRIAARYMRQERPGQTLQPTALVNEAFLRLAGDGRARFAGKTHFVAIAAIAMRRILVERARARRALKRGGGPARVTLAEGLLAHAGKPIDVIALDEALRRLEALDPEQVRIVELRYFGGLTVEETAAAVGVSPATVKRQWAVARAWLKRALDAAPAEPASGRP